MKKAILFITMLSVILTGCQKTPEESAVTSKENGLSQEVSAEPLKKDEKQELEVPEHWKFSEKRSDDRVTIEADLELGKMKTGNLPVIEMKQHEMTEEELNKLVTYFAGGEELYAPQINTKESYREVMNRIENQEGAFGEVFMQSSHQESYKALELAVELAPEKNKEPEKIAVKFQKKPEDPAWWAYLKDNPFYDVEEEKMKAKEEVFFAADVGVDREAYLEAERYNKGIANSSKFQWQQGSKGYTLEELNFLITRCEEAKENRNDPNRYYEKEMNLLQQQKECFRQMDFEEKEGRAQAEQVLKDLGITNMKIRETEKRIWIPKDAGPDSRNYPDAGDFEWRVDFTKAEAGYDFEFSPRVEGIPAVEEMAFLEKEETESYTPPFPVESIKILVTKDGVKAFKWKGMTEEVKNIAQNTKLFPFEKVQSKLCDQIFYWYSGWG